MGTVVTFDVRTPAPQVQVDAALAPRPGGCTGWTTPSAPTKPDSEVNRFDRGELPIDECCEELKKVVALCYKFNGATGGFFDAWASGHFDPSGIVKGWSVERASRLAPGSRFAGPCDRRWGRRPPERGAGNGPALASRCPPPASTRRVLRRVVGHGRRRCHLWHLRAGPARDQPVQPSAGSRADRSDGRGAGAR